jgi:hypothetical protein
MSALPLETNQEAAAGPALAHPPIRRLPTARFTIDGDEHLERDLARLCDVALLAVERTVPRERLKALWLGGGYGRGEGGVLRMPSGDQPYNDLEFYVCLRGNRLLNEHRFGPLLRQLGRAVGGTAGVEVEFQVVTPAQLRHARPSMFYYDLVAGHRQLAGEGALLQRFAHHADPRHLPLSEATRLLMNRGTGLVLARQRLNRAPLDPEDADFVGRNIAKAQLALGDAVLTVIGKYHWSCLERHRRLVALAGAASLPWYRELRQHHAAGVVFKLHPKLTPARAEPLRRDHERVVAFMLTVWLWVESRRLGHEFRSARDYVASTLDKWPEGKIWRNLLLNARNFGPAACLPPGSLRHPRDRVLTALARLLWDDADAHGRIPAIPEAEGCPADPVERYRRIWEPVR